MDNDRRFDQEGGPDQEGPIDIVRTFKSTGMTMGVGEDGGSFWVYDLAPRRSTWHRHCGPYSTYQEAEDWIRSIRSAGE